MNQPETQVVAVVEKPARLKKPQPPPPPAKAVSNLVGAICAISSKAEEIAKTDKHAHGYKYVSWPDVMRVLGPLMNEHGVAVFQSELESQVGPDGVLRISYQFDVTHAPSGETRSLLRSGELKVAGRTGYNDKGSAAIATMVRKYVLIGLFNLIVDDLPDADRENTQEQPRTIRPPAPAPNVMKSPDSPKFDPEIEKWSNKLAQAYAQAAPGSAADTLREVFKTVPRQYWTALLPIVEQQHLPAATEIDMMRQRRTLDDFQP